jgi:hypothetical protein
MITQYLSQLEKFATNDFQKELLAASLNNLSDQDNKLRFNNFACGIRELSRHVLSSMAPDEEVLACSWYKNLTDKENGITRAQRIKYAIQGGLDESYVEDELIAVSGFAKTVLAAISILNKYTHVNEDTFGVSENEVDKLSSEVVNAFSEFVIAIETCKTGLIEVLETHIDENFIENAMLESMDSVDELSTHHSLEDIEPETIKITDLKSNSIIIEVKGSVEVILQWGSNSDLRNGDGLEFPTSFPFSSILVMDIDDTFPKGNIEMENFLVDTSSWYDDEGHIEDII